MMKTFIYLFVLMISLIACGKSPNIQNTSIVSTRVIDSNNIQKDNFDSVVESLNDIMNKIQDKTLEHKEREKNVTIFVSNVSTLLTSPIGLTLSDEELRKTLDYNINSLSLKVPLDGKELLVRIVRFDCLPEICGTLEDKWSLIQWGDKGKVNVQTLIERGNEVVTDFSFSKLKGNPVLLLAGYETTYKPYPTFISIWELSNDRFIKSELFSNVLMPNNKWNYDRKENKLVINAKRKHDLNIDKKQDNKGFIVSLDSNEHDNTEISVNEENIVVK